MDVVWRKANSKSEGELFARCASTSMFYFIITFAFIVAFIGAFTYFTFTFAFTFTFTLLLLLLLLSLSLSLALLLS